MIRKLALFSIFFIVSYIALVPSGQCADNPKRILIIPSYNFNYLGSEWFLRGVMEEFTRHKPFKVTFFHENLRLATHPSDRQYMDDMAASLKIKYRLEKPDLIIIQYRQALQFMERYGKDIFGNVPVVFAGLSVEGYIPDKLPHLYTGIVASFSAKKNIELILNNHPNVKKIYVVGGSSPVEKSLVNEAIKEGTQYLGKVEFIALSDMTFPDVLAKLGKLGDNSVIMYQALQLDAAGKVFVPAQAAIEIARAASVPVYGMLDTYMGSGITGGFLIHHEGLGRRAADIAMQWLQSGVIPDTRVKSEQIGSYRFDGRELKRWGIREDTLPIGSKIEYKAFSVWESYKVEIVGGVCLILLQALLIIGLLRNRYKRIKTEEDLRESEERYRHLVSSSHDWVWETDSNGVYTYASPQVQKILGYTPEELIGKRPFDLMPDDEARRIEEVFVSIASKHEPLHRLENINRHKDGHAVVLETNGSPFFDANGNFLGYRGMDRDITERKRAEEALRESEERYRFVVENSREAIFIAQDGKVAFPNRAELEQTGYPEEILTAIPFTDLIHPEDRDLVYTNYLKRLEGKDIPNAYPFRIVRRDGTIRWVEVNATRILWQGRPASLNFVSDITEWRKNDEDKKLLEERLQRAEKMEALGTLAGGVAHDLNNVLGIVVGYSEMLMDEIGESSSLRDDVIKIMEGGHRSAAIVQDLLTLARRGVQTNKVFNLNAAIMDCQKTPEYEKSSLLNPNVRIKTDLGAELLNIIGSPVHFGKTFINLVANAVEAMPGGGMLTITTSNQSLDKPVHGYDTVNAGDYVVLSITDTGEGISDHDIKRIFEPFYTKKVMGKSGTGLGLAVVWGTVKDHNGYIDVQSEVGKGTTFTLYFPVTREEMAKAEAAIPLSDYIGNDEAILVIDDIKEQRELAAKMLGKLNYRVKTVSSGEVAVEYLRTEKADLLVLDMIMDPGMDGLDTYKAILAIHPKQKAIIVSGFSETDRVLEARSLGAGEYLRKPYVIERLGMAARKELDRQ